MGQGGGKMLFTRQSSGLVREVSVTNALFFNTAAFIGGTLGGAYGIVTNLRRLHPKVAIVWIGQEPPETAHASVPFADADIDHVPGAVTKALIARK